MRIHAIRVYAMRVETMMVEDHEAWRHQVYESWGAHPSEAIWGSGFFHNSAILLRSKFYHGTQVPWRWWIRRWALWRLWRRWAPWRPWKMVRALWGRWGLWSPSKGQLPNQQQSHQESHQQGHQQIHQHRHQLCHHWWWDSPNPMRSQPGQQMLSKEPGWCKSHHPMLSRFLMGMGGWAMMRSRLPGKGWWNEVWINE